MPRSLAYEPQNALNAICPYFTMFPLEYPLRVLKKHRASRPVVMDPFCGRGTTLFAARSLGLAARGIDSSPVAVAIARAKLCVVNAEAALALAKSFIEGGGDVDVPETEFFRYAFAPRVLRAVCAIRQGLLTSKRDTDDVVLLRAAMLGCLHGPTGKRLEAQSYFSNQMPRTFASKPDYSVRYWKARGLEAPAADVLEVLRRKLDRLATAAPPQGMTVAHAVLGDSRYAKSLPASSRDFSVVVTSPPTMGCEPMWRTNGFGTGSLVGLTTLSTDGQHNLSTRARTSLLSQWALSGRTWLVPCRQNLTCTSDLASSRLLAPMPRSLCAPLSKSQVSHGV